MRIINEKFAPLIESSINSFFSITLLLKFILTKGEISLRKNRFYFVGTWLNRIFAVYRPYEKSGRL